MLFKWFVLPVAGLVLKCWSLYKLVGYFQQGHCSTSNKSVACSRQMLSCLGHAYTWKDTSNLTSSCLGTNNCDTHSRNPCTQISYKFSQNELLDAEVCRTIWLQLNTLGRQKLYALEYWVMCRHSDLSGTCNRFVGSKTVTLLEVNHNFIQWPAF